jgi:hypothetical protein
MTRGTLKRREQWRPVLDAEVKRWSAKSYEQLTSELTEEQVYEVEFNGKNHQVEVKVVENTEKYLHVVVTVDDGSVPASFRPLSSSFIREKPGRKDIAGGGKNAGSPHSASLRSG